LKENIKAFGFCTWFSGSFMLLKKGSLYFRRGIIRRWIWLELLKNAWKKNCPIWDIKKLLDKFTPSIDFRINSLFDKVYAQSVWINLLVLGVTNHATLT